MTKFPTNVLKYSTYVYIMIVCTYVYRGNYVGTYVPHQLYIYGLDLACTEKYFAAVQHYTLVYVPRITTLIVSISWPVSETGS
jgi:hypothetical protein